MMSFFQRFSKSLPGDLDVMESVSSRLPLPKDWPQNVKMAVPHVVSLAHMAILHARSLVINSPNAIAGPLHANEPTRRRLLTLRAGK